MKYQEQDTIAKCQTGWEMETGMGEHGNTAKWLGLGDFRQVGIVMRNTDKVLDYYEKTLGIQHFDSAVVVAETDKEKAKLKISLAQLGGIQFELIEPVEGKTVHTDFLQQGREGLHHLGFYAEDLERKLKGLQSKGVKVLETGTIMGIKYAYLDTASVSGVIFELIKIG